MNETLYKSMRRKILQFTNKRHRLLLSDRVLRTQFTFTKCKFLHSIYLLKSNILHDKFVSICSFMPCVVNCVWDQWIIGDCSVTCGEGTRTNTRTQNETAQFGGDECDGSTSAIENCKEQECPGRICLK